jgi:hypothetical protein
MYRVLVLNNIIESCILYDHDLSLTSWQVYDILDTCGIYYLTVVSQSGVFGVFDYSNTEFIIDMDYKFDMVDYHNYNKVFVYLRDIKINSII